MKIKAIHPDITKPRDIIREILSLRKSGSVLDLGAGIGRQSLFLASQGFQVHAVEKNVERLSVLRENAKKLGVKIKITRADVSRFKPQSKYDIVVAAMVLHFLPELQVKHAVRMIQKHTKRGGLNIIVAYTTKNAHGLRLYLFKKNELKNFYKGWHIVKYKESLGPTMKNPRDNGPKRRYRAEIIAKKKIQ